MQLGGSIQHSQGLYNNPYPELYQSNVSYLNLSMPRSLKGFFRVCLTNYMVYGTPWFNSESTGIYNNPYPELNQSNSAY